MPAANLHNNAQMEGEEESKEPRPFQAPQFPNLIGNAEDQLRDVPAEHLNVSGDTSSFGLARNFVAVPTIQTMQNPLSNNENTGFGLDHSQPNKKQLMKTRNQHKQKHKDTQIAAESSQLSEFPSYLGLPKADDQMSEK